MPLVWSYMDPMERVVSYTDRDIQFMRDAERDAQLASARAQSVGGNQWTVTRTTGDGIGEPVVEQAVGTVTGWVFRFKPKRVVVNGAWFQPDDEWRMVANDDAALPVEQRPDLEHHDQVESVAQAEHRYQVMTVERRDGYLVAILEESA